jgi:hypothetical protein
LAVFGVGLLVITLELVGDGLEAGATLDAVAKADPTVVRGLIEASFPLCGAIGLIMSALLLASAGCATLATGVLPRWTGESRRDRGRANYVSQATAACS